MSRRPPFITDYERIIQPRRSRTRWDYRAEGLLIGFMLGFVTGLIVMLEIVF